MPWFDRVRCLFRHRWVKRKRKTRQKTGLEPPLDYVYFVTHYRRCLRCGKVQEIYDKEAKLKAIRLMEEIVRREHEESHRGSEREHQDRRGG